MTKYTKRDLKAMVRYGEAVDATTGDIPERVEQIGYCTGTYGLSGALLLGESGQRYAILERTSNLFRYC